MVTVDDNKNLNRIADTLKADSAVFDDGDTLGLARKILVYDPANDEKLTEPVKPYIYITIPDFPQQSRYDFGVTSPDSINKINRQYKIVIVADSRAKTASSQSQLYDITKNVRDSLQADPTFQDPANPGTDPVFSRSVIVDDPWDSSTRGQLTTSMEFLLLVTIGTDFQLEFPDSGLIIDVRSENRNKGRNSTKIASDEGNTKTSKGEYVGTLVYEYDYDVTTFNQIDTLIEADNEIPVNLIDGTVTTPITVKPVFQNITKPTIDAVKTVLLTLEESTD